MTDKGVKKQEVLLDPKVYHSISISSQKIWEGKFNEAQSVLEEFADLSLSAALAKAEVLIWIYSLNHTPEALNHAITAFTDLESRAERFSEDNKPDGVLSSLVCLIYVIFFFSFVNFFTG